METYEKKQRYERERSIESKEDHEEELTEEARAAATRERAEYLVKEVKSGTQQMQNIMLHMQQVLKELHDLETQLQLPYTTDPSSVVQDKKRIEKLRSKIEQHKVELREMKDDLLAILKSESTQNTHSTETQKRAQIILEEVVKEIDF